jgi:molybdate/tungstate transport system substrate-binding protein
MESDDVPVSRRSMLSGMAVALSGTAGCATVLGRRDGSSEAVSMLVAGSLLNALENGLRPGVDVPVRIEAHGSAEVARLVAAGGKDPDIVSVAATSLFDSPLHPEWFVEFATNAIVVAYDPDTHGGQQLAAAGTEAWYEPLLRGEVALGRTDPDLDPLGYRALFTLELASAYYGTAVDLREAIPRREQIYPETQLITQFETGSIDAAVAYRSMAVERGYDYVELPPEIDLSDPTYAERYSTATYELPSGKQVSGGRISYGATIRDQSPAVVEVLRALTTGRYLTEFGFDVPDDYPTFTGNVPDEVTH